MYDKPRHSELSGFTPRIQPSACGLGLYARFVKPDNSSASVCNKLFVSKEPKKSERGAGLGQHELVFGKIPISGELEKEVRASIERDRVTRWEYRK